MAVVLGAGELHDLGRIELALGFVGLLAVWSPLRIHRGDNVHGLTLEDAVTGAFLLGPHPGLAPLVLITATVVARAAMRPGALKVAYSIAPVGLGSAAAVGVAAFLGTGPSVLSPRSVTTVAIALAAYMSVSFALTAGLFVRLGSTTWRRMMRDSWLPNVVSWIGNVTIALLLALVIATDARAIVLVAVLAVGLQLGYRAYGRVVTDRNRAEELSHVSRSLAAVAAGAMPVQRWLDGVARLFGATAALLVDRNAEPTTSGAVPPEVLTAIRSQRGASGVRRVGGTEFLIVPARDGSSDAGALAVWGRHGFESWNRSDVHLLAAVASEAAVALENADLFEQVMHERARWQEESTKLNDILTAASDGIATFAADGRVVSWNPGMAAFTGVDASQATGMSWWTVLRLRDTADRDLLPEGDHVVASALAGQRHAAPAAVQVLRRDGQWRWLRATFSPLVSDDGVVDGTVMVARDVTAEHEVEALKADFIATVSHELRTPLTPLKGFLATVRQRSDVLSEQQVALLHRSMESQVLRLERLVDDLLVVADLDRGRISLGHELVALREAVEIAIDDEQDAGVDRVQVTGDAAVSAAGDASAIVRVLRALISNALKHTAGTVTVELDRERHTAVVRVTDQGPGIPPWEHEPIFQRFHRLGHHLHRTQGPGLGLSIARGLAEHLGGSLEVDSDVGRGATFTLRLRSAGPVPVRSLRRADAG